MKPSDIFKGLKSKDEKFRIGSDDFSELEISSTPTKESFYYFYHKKDKRLVKYFLLSEGPRVNYICEVILIKKEEKFTPRLTFSVRDKSVKVLERSRTEEENTNQVKARISLDSCHENFWALIAFLQSLREQVEVPSQSFSLVSHDAAEVVSALKGKDIKSIVDIIKQLASMPGITLSEDDLSVVIKRREKLAEFKQGLIDHSGDESWWQSFFEENKWIFGYGLNYQILKQELSQPHYGGQKVDGKGDQRGDYLTSTVGTINFTVLVEIKTPDTLLLQGSAPIRNGAWSLSKDLSDAHMQIEANIHTWEKEGSEQVDTKDRLEGGDIFTVKPKGIIVIGSLTQLVSERSRRETFERFRKSIHGVDIITFDELYQRASFIVENKHD